MHRARRCWLTAAGNELLTNRSWLPDGRELVTLKDAGNYITKLSKAEHEAPEWLTAAQALLLVAERGGPTMLARVGMMRALNAGKPDPATPPCWCWPFIAGRGAAIWRKYQS